MTSSMRPAAVKLLRLVVPSQTTTSTSARALSTTAASSAESSGDKTSFFGGFFDRQVAVQEQPHSAKFASAKEEIVELQTHNVRPDAKDQYLDAHGRLVDYLKERSELLHW